MERIICLVVGYAFGLIESGYLYGKMNGIDIRQHGSGNSGTTNALRVLGKKAGLVVFIGDVLKTMIPCVAVRILFRDDPPMGYLLTLYTGLGVILGHNYPFYLKFQGGKGIGKPHLCLDLHQSLSLYPNHPRQKKRHIPMVNLLTSSGSCRSCRPL